MEKSDLNRLSELSAGNYEAFFYDCDGTLADNMACHTETYVEVARTYNVTIDSQMIYELAGWPIANVVLEINKRYSCTINPDEFKFRKAQIYMERYIDTIQPIDYVVNHLKAHVGKKRIAVVSGGDRIAIEKTLRVLGISEMVEVLVCSGDTKAGKPYPDPFLRAAELLNVAPDKCLVFEDGNPGVLAAKAAGMDWIRVDKFQRG
jgi:HAD superfamily hydrolase (TIGR01509 family)